YLGKEAFGNPSSAHRFGRAARAGVEEAKRAIAEAVGAEPNQVVFTSGGTEADNLAIIGAALAARDRGGPFRVAVSATEHKAALAAAHAVKHLGGDEVILPVTASGTVDDAALDAALGAGVAVVSVMWGNNEVGTVQPVARTAQRARAARIERLDPRHRQRGHADAPGPRGDRLLVRFGVQHRRDRAVARADGDGRAARSGSGGAAVLLREGQHGRGRRGRRSGAPQG